MNPMTPLTIRCSSTVPETLTVRADPRERNMTFTIDRQGRKEGDVIASASNAAALLAWMTQALASRAPALPARGKPARIPVGARVVSTTRRYPPGTKGVLVEDDGTSCPYRVRLDSACGGEHGWFDADELALDTVPAPDVDDANMPTLSAIASLLATGALPGLTSFQRAKMREYLTLAKLQIERDALPKINTADYLVPVPSGFQTIAGYLATKGRIRDLLERDLLRDGQTILARTRNDSSVAKVWVEASKAMRDKGIETKTVRAWPLAVLDNYYGGLPPIA